MASEDLSNYDLASAALLNRPDVQVLGPEEERRVLLELDECKRLLMDSRPMPSTAGVVFGEEDREEIQDVVRELLDRAPADSEQSRQLEAVARRYNSLRTRLAMANLRLVAHVAKKYRNRGISSSDLLQEGFCGLLKAIDRFEPTRETRLASYAVWWIRQALQRAVAAGAYPVRLNPRHLQQLAMSNPELQVAAKPGRKPRSRGAASTLRRIHSATRPAISLNANLRADEGLSLLNSLTYPAHDEVPGADLDEYLVVMMKELKPREQVVLQLRFGLGGQSCHSLSEVSEVLDVSKERIRQIQEGALEKLRNLAKDKVFCEAAV
jgi:RNA polymerase primary sigma factor